MSNVDLHLDPGSMLLGGPDPFKYPLFPHSDLWRAERAQRWNRRAMFYTVGQTNVSLTGSGTIDGNALAFHHQDAKGKWVRNSDTNITGRCLFFAACQDVKVEGVLIRNPAGWSTWFLDCDRVGIHRHGTRGEGDVLVPARRGRRFRQRPLVGEVVRGAGNA